MIAQENADGKWSEKKMEKEDGLRTVECLRGRLIAERAASRKAKEDAELMGNKLIELETKLREETRSRNKAEKKLKYFLKKLESMNISYVSDESEKSRLLDKSEISSATSTTASSSSTTKISEENSQFQDSTGSRKCSSEYLEDHFQELISQESSIKSEKNALEITSFSQGDDNSHAKGGQVLGKSSELEFSNSDANSSRSSPKEEGKNGEDERDLQEDINVNNSLALVPLNLPKPKESIDPIVLDSTVREVLDALRHAKEKLQTQMERGRSIKVG